MQFFIYSRKSVYTGKGESIENQIEMCRQYISSKYSAAPIDSISVYEDEGFSAKNTDRPQFQKMLDDIKTAKPDVLVCYRLDRISRNVSDFSALIESLNEQNITFICIKEEFDTSKPMGKAMMYIASVFAQLERETIAERVRDNMRMLARTGRWLGGTPPTGYFSEKVQEIIMDGKVKFSCRLQENPEELAVVQAIFEKFLETHSLSAVSKYLISNGVKSKNGSFYSPLSIKLILKNPVYCTADRDALQYFREENADVCFDEGTCSHQYGLIAYNKRNYTKKHAPRQPTEKWIVAVGRHRGLISGRKWVAVQRILNGRKGSPPPFPIHNDYALLSGLLFCKRCGSRMFAKPRSGQPGSFDYICSNKLRGRVALCSAQNIKGAQADQIVCEALEDYIKDGSNFCPLLRDLQRTVKNTLPSSSAAKIEQAIQKKNEEADNLITALSHGNLNSEFIGRANSRLKQIGEDIASLSAERQKLAAAAKYTENSKAEMEEAAEALVNIAEVFKKSAVYEKRAVLKILIEKIVWDGSALEIYCSETGKTH